MPSPTERSQQRITQFLGLLKAESCQSKSDTIPETAWPALTGLHDRLNQLPDEDFEAIDDAILDWLEDNELNSIQKALQGRRADPLGDNEEPPPATPTEQATNNCSVRSCIQTIEDAITQRQRNTEGQ